MRKHMVMSVRIDPQVPLVWRTPTTVQLGVDDVRLVTDVTPPEEHLLHALRTGATRGTLTAVGHERGLSDADIDEFLSRLAPALEAQPEPPPPAPVRVIGTGATADILRSRLADRVTDDVAPIGVIVTHFVVDPLESVRWLSRDIVHLPVVFTDVGVRVGPLIVPGAGPCLHCLERERADADPAWPAIATQLTRASSPLDAGRFARDAAVETMRLLREFERSGVPPLPAISVTIAPHAAQTVCVHRPHPSCGCRSPEGNASAHSGVAAPSETSSG